MVITCVQMNPFFSVIIVWFKSIPTIWLSCFFFKSKIILITWCYIVKYPGANCDKWDTIPARVLHWSFQLEGWFNGLRRSLHWTLVTPRGIIPSKEAILNPYCVNFILKWSSTVGLKCWQTLARVILHN